MSILAEGMGNFILRITHQKALLSTYRKLASLEPYATTPVGTESRPSPSTYTKLSYPTPWPHGSEESSTIGWPSMKGYSIPPSRKQ